MLYPSNVGRSVQAVQKAIDEKRLDADKIQQSIERRRRWARWAALSRDANRPARDESGWSTQLAEQVVHVVRGKLPSLEQPWKLVIVDDDLGGPYPAPSRDPFISTLTAGGVEVVMNGGTQIETKSIVVALFGDIRAWKGRPGFSAAAREAVHRALEDASPSERLIVQFSHPRLAGELGGDAPILCAWGGEAVMQRAAARLLLREMAATTAARSTRAAG
jgi:beta-glucosidase